MHFGSFLLFMNFANPVDGGGDGGRSSCKPPAPNPITPKDSISCSGILPYSRFSAELGEY